MKGLPPRRRDVLLLAPAGNSNAQIARALGISPITVARHLTEVYDQLGARDRAHAVALAVWHGDITLADLAQANSQQQEAAA